MTIDQVTAGAGLRSEVEDFLYYEAELLDERRYREWLELLSPEIRYRVPIAQNVHSTEVDREYFDGDLDIYWMDEGIETLTARVEQLLTGIHWAEEPVSRTTHVCANVRVVEAVDTVDGLRVLVHSRLLLYRNRVRGIEDLLAGRRVDRLLRSDDGWRIAERTVHLDQTTLLANNLTTFL